MHNASHPFMAKEFQMSILDLIYENNPVHFDLMPELKARPVCIHFGKDIPGGLQQEILQAVNQLSIPTENRGIPIQLQLDPENDNTVALFQADALLYRFCVDSHRSAALAIGWCIYLVSVGKPLSGNHAGDYVSCICFSAQQQAAASRLLQSVQQQYSTSIPEEQIQAIGTELLGLLAPFYQKIPLFSERPIAETAYERIKGTVLEGSVGEVARRLFGSEPFDDVIASFLSSLKSGTPYRGRFQEACELMKTWLYNLPLMSINYFFDEFSQKVNAISGCTAQDMMEMAKKQLKISFSDRNINIAFTELDKAYFTNAQAQLQKGFLSDVLSTVRDEIEPEVDEIKGLVKRYHRSLADFCFVDKGCFGIGGPGKELLNWHRLAHLDAATLRGPNIGWDWQTLNSLQINVKSRFFAQAWLCSDRLKNLAISNYASDAHAIISVPVQDERLVWVLIREAARG